MGEDERTPAQQNFDKVLSEVIAEAVEAETRRCAALALDWGTSSVPKGDTAAHRRCRNLAADILKSAGLEPAAPEES